MLCHVDVDNPDKALAEVTKAAVTNNCTLVCAWSQEVCGGEGRGSGRSRWRGRDAPDACKLSQRRTLSFPS